MRRRAGDEGSRRPSIRREKGFVIIHGFPPSRSGGFPLLCAYFLPLTTRHHPPGAPLVVARVVSGPRSAMRVVMATCSDERHPPEHALDEDDATFWVTTGMYPQEIVVRLDQAREVNRLRTLTTNVRKLALECCDGPTPEKFRPVFEVELPEKDGRPQTETHQFSAKGATFLKLTIASGWGHFASVHRVQLS